jgi:ABC-type Fe3+-hydroxamate transport system substrate-binding protein
MTFGFDFSIGPQRIICMTEETTEWLYLLGQEHRIVGISGYTVRPARARHEKPRISAFTSAKIDKILALQPDCVLGFSDLQADIASTLIRQGVQVTIFNQRSVAEILSMLYQVGAMVGQAQQAIERIAAMQAQMQAVALAASALPSRPRVYFEEWDEPPISASWRSSPWVKTASLPMAWTSYGATRTSSSVPGAVKNSVPKKSRHVKAGKKSKQCSTASCLKSNRPTYCNPARHR